jgi:hypothetical protein
MARLRPPPTVLAERAAVAGPQEVTLASVRDDIDAFATQAEKLVRRIEAEPFSAINHRAAMLASDFVHFAKEFLR